MSDKLFIFDTTLRDGEQVPGCQLNTVEKIQVARQLEALGVDVIEAGFPISSPGDFNSVIEISKAVTWPTICALTRAVQKDIDVAAEALQFAKHKRIHTGIGTSDSHIRYKFNSNREEIIERAGNTSLEEVAMIIRCHKDIDIETNINTQKIYPTSRMVSSLMNMPVQPNKAIVGRNAFAHSSGIHQDGVLKNVQTYEIIDPHDVGIDDNSIVLTARSGRAALKNRLQVLGVSLDQQKLDKIYEDFLKLADKKKDINDDDILVLAGADRSQNHRIKLEYLQVTSGVGVRSVASIGLNISGEKFEAAASGNGPVDAAIKALKKIIDRHMTLKEFTIQAISKGSDDMGKVHMQVEYDNRIYYGFGANTDIIAASVEAYIDCINKF